MHDISIRKILCPVDYSERSDYALAYAVDLAKRFSADLHLLHVVELPFFPSYAMAGVPDLSIPVEQIEENARKQMTQTLDQCRREFEKVDGEVRTGTAFLEIINCARDCGADMIVLGTHGRTGLRHMIIGSVAEKVVRKAPCPVLTVKHPDQKFEMP